VRDRWFPGLIAFDDYLTDYHRRVRRTLSFMGRGFKPDTEEQHEVLGISGHAAEDLEEQAIESAKAAGAGAFTI